MWYCYDEHCVVSFVDFLMIVTVMTLEGVRSCGLKGKKGLGASEGLNFSGVVAVICVLWIILVLCASKGRFAIIIIRSIWGHDCARFPD